MNANTQAPRVRPDAHRDEPDAADVSVRLTGWSSPPLTILLVALSVAFFVAGWRARRAEGLSAWQRFLVLPVIVGAVAAIAIPYSSLNNVAGPWQPRWGVRLLVVSVLMGTLGYVLCAMTGRDGERGARAQPRRRHDPTLTPEICRTFPRRTSLGNPQVSPRGSTAAGRRARGGDSTRPVR